jgi:hypothetical protein
MAKKRPIHSSSISKNRGKLTKMVKITICTISLRQIDSSPHQNASLRQLDI